MLQDLPDLEKQAAVNSETKHVNSSPPSDAGRGRASKENFPSQAKDFDERAANLWSVYVQEAESHDRALIETWKDDMEGVMIFAGLYSASLTAFLVESYQNLQPDPAQEAAFSLNQSVYLLAQISQQLGPNGSQVSIQLPQALPAFSPQPSDVRVNVFWFMSLVFSLGAALAATIVQQWVRDYMHVFQRYNNSLKRARVRQFLFEGADRWNMSIVVDGIPALIHISLFLFFIGLADFLFSLNYIVAVMTTLMIAFCGAAYIWSMVAPVLNAQSPYQTPLSGIFWWFVQTFRARQHSDNGTSGERRLVSTNMTDGRVELAMDESEDRRNRDARAIRWVIDNLTEDSELEPFVAGIPGSLSSPWGKEVWGNVAENQPFLGEVPDENANHSSGDTARVRYGAANGHQDAVSSSLHHDPVNDLSDRITRLMKTCTDPGILSEQARRKRARACTDAALSLVLSVDAVNGEWRWFADGETLFQALLYLSVIEGIRLGPRYPADFDGAFAARWTCMAILATRKSIQKPTVREAADKVVTKMAYARVSTESSPLDDSAMKTAYVLDKRLRTAWIAARNLRDRLASKTDVDKKEDFLNKVLTEGEDDLAELESAWNRMGWTYDLDTSVLDLVRALTDTTGGVFTHLPGVAVELPPETRRSPDGIEIRQPRWLIPQLVPPRVFTQRLWLCAWNLRSLSSSSQDSVNWPSFSQLSAPELASPELQQLMNHTEGRLSTQSWRIQDIRDGGLVYTIELLVGAIRSGGTMSLESRPLYVATLQKITADWKSHRNSRGSQKCLIALLRDILPTTPKTDLSVPSFVVEPMLELLGNIVSGSEQAIVKEALALIDCYLNLEPHSTAAHNAKLKVGT